MSIGGARDGTSHPALRELARERQSRFEDRLADSITQFAGSMNFVYVHVIWFSFWIVLPVEEIFLSTFILISQNRADGKRQVVADHQWELVQSRDEQIEELMSISRELLPLTRDVHEALSQIENVRPPA
jgi:uncharacterized membrane protein